MPSDKLSGTPNNGPRPRTFVQFVSVDGSVWVIG